MQRDSEFIDIKYFEINDFTVFEGLLYDVMVKYLLQYPGSCAHS
jgi:hypothetical protein